MRTQTIQTLEARRVTKGELFQGVRDIFDYALPQDWIDAFSTWCAGRFPEVTYHLILSTTVWAYPRGYLLGRPLTACTEVRRALDAWNRTK